MSIVWTIAAVLASPFVIEFCFRIFVARRIQTVIESVPPLALIEASPHNTGRAVSVGPDLSVRVFVNTPTPRALVIFCPELDGGAESAALYCKPLIDANFAVVGIDLSASPDKPQPIHWTTEAEVEKVERVLEYLPQLPQFFGLPIGIFGVSRGGTVALISACRSQTISSVVTDSGYSSMGLTRNFVARFGKQIIPEWLFERLPSWHIDKALWMAFGFSEKTRSCCYVHLEHEFRNLNQPVLMISGRRDSYVTPDVTSRLAELLAPDTKTWFVGKAKHNKARLQSPEEYANTIVAHFKKTLLDANQADWQQDSSQAYVA